MVACAGSPCTSFPFKKPQDFRAFFSHAAFQKAEYLQLRGGVADLDVSEDGRELAAYVQGSQAWPYHVEIVLKPDKHGRGDTYPAEVRQRLIYGVRVHAEGGQAPVPVVLVCR
jgi:hypothetical protein